MSNVFGQTNEPIYLYHDHNYSTTYSYEVSEITIHSDSSYTLKRYLMKNRKTWKTYKDFEPEISSGKIRRNGKFYTLTEYGNGNKTDIEWNVKVTKSRLIFYFNKRKDKLKKSIKYKRVKLIYN